MGSRYPTQYTSHYDRHYNVVYTNKYLPRLEAHGNYPTGNLSAYKYKEFFQSRPDDQTKSGHHVLVKSLGNPTKKTKLKYCSQL